MTANQNRCQCSGNKPVHVKLHPRTRNGKQEQVCEHCRGRKGSRKGKMTN